MRILTALLACLITLSAGAQNHRLNLQDAEMAALIATVSEITGKSFIVDPRVEGRVTVISNQSMTPEQIYEVFLSVLRVHNLAAVPSGAFVKIVPDASAFQDTVPMTSTSGGPDALVTQVVAVNHVAAPELVQLLRPLIPQNGSVVAHPGSNSLVISDRAGNVERLRRLIDRIDRVSEDDVELIALEHANAAEIVRMLNLLNDQGGAAAAGPKVIADDRTNSVLLAGDPSSRLRLRTMISHLDTPLESGSTQVIYLSYAAADSMVALLEQVAQSLDGANAEPGAGGAKTTIQAHPETNSLVISATPSIFRSLKSIVRQLDIRRQQVMVEAIIAEVSGELTRELGVQWQAAEIESLNDSGIVGGTNFPTNSGVGPGILGLSGTEQGLVNLAGLGSGLNLGYLSGSINIPTGMSDANGDPIFTQVPQLSALVSALSADVDTNVLSTPSIVTLDHQEAVINVGQEVPFLTGQFAATGAANSQVNPFQTIERQDVGLTLTVTPHINKGDTVVMDIVQEVSSLSPQSGAVDLITNTREITTTVMVPDGNVLVLGGLIDDDIRETIRKVPALGDIPIVGNLFKYRSSKRVKRNLMVFIRPVIMKDDATRNAITGSKYNHLRDAQLRERDRYEGLQNSTDLPLLPELSDYIDEVEKDDGSP